MAESSAWGETEDVFMSCQPLVIDQSQYESAEAEDEPMRPDLTGGYDESHCSTKFFFSPSAGFHEDTHAFATQDHAWISLQSNQLPDNDFMNPEALCWNPEDDEQPVAWKDDTNNGGADWQSKSQSSTSMGPPAYSTLYGSQPQANDQFLFGLQQDVSTARNLSGGDRGVFAGGSIDDIQVSADANSMHFPEYSLGADTHNRYPFQQPSYRQQQLRAQIRQDLDGPNSISSSWVSNDINTFPNANQLLSRTMDDPPNAISSIPPCDEPWSSVTLRQQGDRQTSMRDRIGILEHRTTRSQAVTTGMSSGTDASSIPGNDTEYSTSSFDSTCDNMMESCKTIRGTESQLSGWQWPTYGQDPHTPALSDMPSPVSIGAGLGPFLTVNDRLLQDEQVNRQPQISQLAEHVNHSNKVYLSVPSQDDERSEQVSEGSNASGPIPDTIHCEVCNVEFQGDYRKGNKARHMRLTHSGTPTAYVCEVCPNGKVFKRQDARLKHYRKIHPQLGFEPARPRKTSCVSATSGSSRAKSMMQ